MTKLKKIFQRFIAIQKFLESSKGEEGYLSQLKVLTQ